MYLADAAPIRYTAYVFDDIHATLADLTRAGDATKRYLSAPKARDRAAIFTLSGNIELDFTDDRSKLNDALRRIRPHSLTATGPTRCPNISYDQADLIKNKNDAMALGQATDEAMQCEFAGDPSARRPARLLAVDTAAEVLIAGRAESQSSFDALRKSLAEPPACRVSAASFWFLPDSRLPKCSRKRQRSSTRLCVRK